MNLQAFAFAVGFLAILALFICYICRAAKRFSGKVAPRSYNRFERAVIAGVVVGVIGTFQPWQPAATNTALSSTSSQLWASLSGAT